MHTNVQIKRHEEYKQLCLSSKKNSTCPVPSDYHLWDTVHDDSNGFFACIYQKDNTIVIVYRGSDDKQDWLDSNKDMFIGNMPSQAENALELYDMTAKFCNENNMHLVVIGYSLGGSLAQIVGALRGAETVTFNAYAVKQLLNPNIKYFNNNIVNYCNNLDPITKIKAKNHIGKSYIVNSKNKFNNPHYLENMGSLYEAKEIKLSESQEQSHDLVSNNLNKLHSFAKELSDHFGRNIILMPGLHSDDNTCSGSYPVRGYERKDGTKVDGYIRECFKHGNPQTQPAREKYKSMKLNQLNKNQLLELLDDLL